MSESANLKCGVVGVGYLGQHHARIYAGELPGCELVGLYDVDHKRAKEIASKHGCQVFGSIAELGEACDVVSVVVPTDLHCIVALDLLAQGCHLLVEKPLCTSVEEAEKMLEAAQKADRILQVGHIEHFNPVMAFLEKNVKDPRFITADRLAPFKPRGIEVGVILDLMIHDIGIILQLVKSPIERIDAIGINVLTKTEDIANARISFANGCVANINTSRMSIKGKREIRIFQPDAYLSLNFGDQKGHIVKKSRLGIPQDIPIEKGEPLKIELDSFADCVIHREDPKVDANLGKRALEVAIKITEQIREHGEKYHSK